MQLPGDLLHRIFVPVLRHNGKLQIYHIEQTNKTIKSSSTAAVPSKAAYLKKEKVNDDGKVLPATVVLKITSSKHAQQLAMRTGKVPKRRTVP